MTRLTTGFIGLGNIGKPMARRLLGTELRVHVYDVVTAPVEELAAEGAKAATTASEIARACEIIGICVRDDDDVDDLLYGEDGLLANGQENAVIAIHSTVKRSNILRWSRDAQGHSIHLIDAPISGGAEAAADGTLCYMVGGEEATVNRCAPIFSTAARTIVHAGPVGAGIVLKLANNLMNYAAFVAADEGVKLVAANGLDPQKLYEVGRVNGVVTPLMHRFISNRELLAQQCSAEDMESIFGSFAGLAEKDLDHALELARQCELRLTATEQVRSLIRKTFLRQ